MWKCNKCEAMVEDNEAVCPVCGDARPEETIEVSEEIQETENGAVLTEEVAQEVAIEEISEEEIAPEEADETNIVDFAPAKRNNKLIVLIAAIAAVVVLTVGIFGYYFLNRYLKPTGENMTITYKDFDKVCDGIFGDEVALNVNGVEISRDEFEYFLNYEAISYQEVYTYGDDYIPDVSRLNGFDWNAVADKKTGETHKDKVIAQAMNTCIEAYAFVSLADVNDVKPTKEDLASAKESVKSLKELYGDNLENTLMLYGYSSLEQYEKVVNTQLNVSAIYADVQANFDKYLTDDMKVFPFEDPTDVIAYQKRTAKVLVNKSLIEDMEIKGDFKKLYEEEQAAAAAEAEAEETTEE